MGIDGIKPEEELKVNSLSAANLFVYLSLYLWNIRIKWPKRDDRYTDCDNSQFR